MNVKNFLTKLWATVKSLLNSFPSTIKQAVHIGVVIAENVKQFVDSPIADVITAIIPGDVDDKVKLTIRLILPKLFEDLKLTDASINSTDSQKKLKFAIQTLQNLDSNMKNALLHNLSVLIAQVLSDGKLNWSDGVCIVEWYYQHKFKKSAN